MKVLGLRSYKDKISWALVEGASRATAALTSHHSDSAPGSGRGEVLAWVREEVAGLMAEHSPDAVVLCPAEGQQLSNAIGERAQVDGVILEVTHSLGTTATAKKGATLRANFGAQNNAAFQAVVNALPAMSGIGPTAERREPTIAALSALPEA